MKTATCATNPPAMKIVDIADVPLRDSPAIRKWGWLTEAFDKLPEGKALMIDVPIPYVNDALMRSDEFSAEAKRKGRKRDGYRHGVAEQFVWSCERLRSQVYQQLMKHCKTKSPDHRATARCTRDYGRVAIFKLGAGEKLNLHEVSIEPTPPNSDAA